MHSAVAAVARRALSNAYGKHGTNELQRTRVVIVECAVSMNAHQILTNELLTLESKLKAKANRLNQAAAQLSQMGISINFGELTDACTEIEKARDMVEEIISKSPTA